MCNLLLEECLTGCNLVLVPAGLPVVRAAGHDGDGRRGGHGVRHKRSSESSNGPAALASERSEPLHRPQQFLKFAKEIKVVGKGFAGPPAAQDVPAATIGQMFIRANQVLLMNDHCS